MATPLTEEQEEIRRTVRDLLRERSTETEVRRLMETADGYDAAVWAEMAELGLQGLAIPEEHGGVGLGQRELALVFEAMGEVLLCAPFFATVALAANALLASEDEAAMADLLPGLATGERIATLACEGAATATESSGGWRVDGATGFVLDGATAGLVLVLAVAPAGPTLFAVDGAAAGLSRTPLETLDQTRKQAALAFDGVEARPVGEVGGGAAIVERALDLARVALAAEQVGGAQHALDVTVAYAKERHQFDRPIGSFQAIKHTCANMLIKVEGARAAMVSAVDAAEGPADALAVAASVAKACCSDAYYEVAADAIHVHGGTGFTWEHPAHLYFRRAKSSQLLLGTPAAHRERLAALAVLEAAVDRTMVPA